jgi:hypothetical protein
LATNNFNYDNKLGEGGFGSVYWGQLWDGSQVLFLLNYEPQESSFCSVQPFFPLHAAVLDSGLLVLLVGTGQLERPADVDDCILADLTSPCRTISVSSSFQSCSMQGRS